MIRSRVGPSAQHTAQNAKLITAIMWEPRAHNLPRICQEKLKLRAEINLCSYVKRIFMGLVHDGQLSVKNSYLGFCWNPAKGLVTDPTLRASRRACAVWRCPLCSIAPLVPQADEACICMTKRTSWTLNAPYTPPPLFRTQHRKFFETHRLCKHLAVSCECVRERNRFDRRGRFDVGHWRMYTRYNISVPLRGNQSRPPLSLCLKTAIESWNLVAQ
jgi:hypothetical protein